MTKEYLNNLTFEINAAIIEVHKTMGPGLLERIYMKCLMHELDLRGLTYETEKELPISYKALDLSSELRCDLLVEDIIMIELKAVKEIEPIFKAKLLCHMKLTNIPKGLLVNFNVTNIMREGHETLVNEHYTALPD